MKWSEFNDVVRTYLLVDRERKGRGVQEYIDRMIVAAVIDLQRYVPQLREHQFTMHSPENLVEPQAIGLYSAGIPNAMQSTQQESVDVHQGIFESGKRRIKQVIIRRAPTSENNQERSRYYYPNTIPWDTRFDLIDGGVVERTTNIPGRICFGPTSFWVAPRLRDDEVMYVYYSGEVHFSPLYKSTDDEKDTIVIFDDMVAKAVSSYVKGHLAREVDNDIQEYQSYMAMYNKERALIFLNEKEYNSSRAGATGLLEDELLTGFDHDGTIVPDQYNTFTTAIVNTAANIQADEETARTNFVLGLQGQDTVAYSLILTSTTGGTASYEGSSNVFPAGVNVDITATPQQGFKFKRWIGVGVVTPSSSSTTVAMDDNRYVRAEFVPG